MWTLYALIQHCAAFAIVLFAFALAEIIGMFRQLYHLAWLRLFIFSSHHFKRNDVGSLPR